jgi:PAP2 superfamily protein
MPRAPRRFRLVPAGALLALAACGRSAPPADLGFVTRWTKTHYALARAERLSPPVASRLTAYAAVALYEGWAAFSDSLRSLAGQLNGLDALPRPRREERYDPALVALEAQTVVLRELYKEGFASTQVAISVLHDSLLAVRKAQGVSPQVADRSRAYGKELADAILAWASKDGFAGRSFAYTPLKGPEYWIPTATEAQYRSQMLSMDRDFVGLDNPTAAARPGVLGDRSITVDRPKRATNTSTPGINLTVALEPHWGEERFFAVRPSDSCVAPPPPVFSPEKGSEFDKFAREIHDIGVHLTPVQRAIAYFWADNPGESGTPAGHWLSALSSIASEWHLSPERTVEAYVLTALAVADGFTASWHEKFRSNLLRPVTYIQRYIDPKWQPLLITPSFPTYTSAHSTQSRAAAEVLTKLFGDRRAYDDSTHITLGHPVKHVTSFLEAADEAGLSRLYGGIHYRFDHLGGQALGACVGRAVLSRVHTRAAK